MGLLRFLTDAFIATFGITVPTPDKRRMVELTIGGSLAAVVAFIAGLGIFFYFQLHAGR